MLIIFLFFLERNNINNFDAGSDINCDSTDIDIDDSDTDDGENTLNSH